MNRTVDHRSHALLRALCAFLAFALGLSSSGASMAGSWWGPPRTEWRSSSPPCMLVQSPRDGDRDATDPPSNAAVGWMDEEEEDDDPVADAPRAVSAISDEESLAVVWERPDCDRPVSDPVADESHPPPRA